MTYRHVFFDLDHTIWDFAKNSKEALEELYERHDLAARNIRSFEQFYQVYVEVNNRFWTLYRLGKMTKKTLRSIRFQTALQRFGIDDEELGKRFGEDYIKLSPYKTALFPHSHEILTYLKEKGYALHIITNGFEEVQHIKLRESKLDAYFEHVVTSETVQARKPNPVIFEHAFSLAGAKAEESIMIGDNLEADILGAQAVGMAQIFFNPHAHAHEAEVDHEIKRLQEIESIL